jgi:hypothetical protein
MHILKISDSLAGAYHGSGWALGSVANGELVALRYVDDLAPFSVAFQLGDGNGAHADFFIKVWLDTAEAAPVVRGLQALGDVVVGMCSCWEFVVH